MGRDDTTAPTVQIRRILKAGADEIFDLWTKLELMVRWLSPFPGAVECKASCDLRPGGAFSLVMSSGSSIREVSGAYVADRATAQARVHLERPADEPRDHVGER